MNVLIINNSDSVGGAARAAFRLHQGLQKKGKVEQHIRTQMLVQSKQSDNADVLGSSATSGIGQAKAGLRLTLDQLPLKRYKNRTGTTFSPQWVPERIAARVHAINPDVINLHWINAGFVQIETLAQFKQPIVWTLHDMWAFTGGCHYDQGCDRYQTQCKTCPQLGSQKERDLARWIWRRKRKVFEKLNLTIVTPSAWLGRCAQSSPLLKDRQIHVIPNGINEQIYRPMGQQTARAALRLPADKKLLLFGSLNATSDQRKGFHRLQAALKNLKESGAHGAFELVIFGASKPENPPDLGFKTHYLGSFSDDLSLAFVFSAADAFVLPSLQENLANTVIEALACGTPCLAFDIGGMPDMIEHGKNGYLAKPFEINDLAKGIATLLNGEINSENGINIPFADANHLSRQARESVINHFTLDKQADRYHALFQNLHPSTEQPLPLVNEKISGPQTADNQVALRR